MKRAVLVAAIAAASGMAHSVAGLGEVLVTPQADGVGVRFELRGVGFAAARTTRGGDVEYEIGGGGELMALHVRIGAGPTLSIRRGANVVSGTANVFSTRTFTEGRAVAAFREHVGEFERLLLSRVHRGTRDPYGHGFLLQAALIAELSGDPVAVSRARDIVMGQDAGPTAVQDRCIAPYERALPDVDRERRACGTRADADDSWHARVGARLACDVSFVSAVAAAEANFTECRIGRWSGSFLSGRTTNWLVQKGGR